MSLRTGNMSFTARPPASPAVVGIVRVDPVSLRQVAPTVTPINVPTLGEARSTDSAIGTLAQAGAFFGPNSGSPAPFARARATAEVTRFFEFNSLNPTVPIDFEYLLTGGLRHQRDNRSSGASLASSLEMNLEILDDSLSVIATPLRVFVTATGVNGNTLAVNTYGSQVDRDWVVSNIEFQDNTASNTSYLRDLLWDVRVLERVENGFQAPVGVPVGFRWSFESFAEVTNYTRTDALGNIAESNFLNTLTLPEATFEISASDTGSSSFSEIAVIPEPRALVIIYLLPVVLLLRRPPSTTRRAR